MLIASTCFLEVLLEENLITAIFNQNSSNTVERLLSGNEICMCLLECVLMWNELLLSIVLERERVSFGTCVNVLISFLTFIRMLRRGHGGRPRRQDMPIPDDIPV